MSDRPSSPTPKGEARRRRPATLLVAVTIVAGALAFAAVGRAGAESPTRQGRPGASSPATEPTGTARTVVGTGIARVRGVPDVLTMTLGVSSRGRTVSEALERSNRAANAVIGILLDGGIDKRDIQTSSFSIGPVHDDRSADVIGYQVSNLMTVRLRELDKAGALIDRVADAGGDDVVMHGVSFSFDDTSDLVAQARTEAVKRARTQAEQLASAAGVELGEVLRISEASPGAGPVLSAPESVRTQLADTPIEPGSEELMVQVTIVFRIR
jgi:uncharacterized protein YggE